MIRIAVLAGALLIATSPVSASASPTVDDVVVSIEPANRSVVLGESLDLTVTVSNRGGEPSADLVVHLDITDPERTTSVDPEDWTSTLTQPIGVIAPGASVSVDWTIQPISPGVFSAYAVAISRDPAQVAVSNVLTVDVADQRTLDPGGILPIAAGMPALIGGLLLARTLTTRRSGRRTGTDPKD
jgi:hypothetical protein